MMSSNLVVNNRPTHHHQEVVTRPPNKWDIRGRPTKATKCDARDDESRRRIRIVGATTTRARRVEVVTCGSASCARLRRPFPPPACRRQYRWRFYCCPSTTSSSSSFASPNLKRPSALPPYHPSSQQPAHPRGDPRGALLLLKRSSRHFSAFRVSPLLFLVLDCGSLLSQAPAGHGYGLALQRLAPLVVKVSSRPRLAEIMFAAMPTCCCTLEQTAAPPVVKKAASSFRLCSPPQARTKQLVVDCEY